MRKNTWSRLGHAAALLMLLGAGCTSKDTLGNITPELDGKKSGTEAVQFKNNESKPMQTSGYAFPGVLPEAERMGKAVKMVTSKGEIEFKIFGDEAPNAASNFIYLTQKGFYNGLKFHRVEPGFVIQGGDPMGNGYGGPGYKFEDDPVKRKYTRGIVAMANSGKNTNGSQFFIMLEDTPLPPNYSIFGEVTKGMDVVDAIRVGDVMQTVEIK